MQYIYHNDGRVSIIGLTNRDLACLMLAMKSDHEAYERDHGHGVGPGLCEMLEELEAAYKHASKYVHFPNDDPDPEA